MALTYAGDESAVAASFNDTYSTATTATLTTKSLLMDISEEATGADGLRIPSTIDTQGELQPFISTSVSITTT